MPNFNFVNRDYPNVYDMWITVGPNIKNGYGTKGVKIQVIKCIKSCSIALEHQSMKESEKAILIYILINKAINAILLMSGATNGKRAVEGWKSMEEKTGKKLSSYFRRPRKKRIIH